MAMIIKTLHSPAISPDTHVRVNSHKHTHTHTRVCCVHTYVYLPPVHPSIRSDLEAFRALTNGQAGLK